MFLFTLQVSRRVKYTGSWPSDGDDTDGDDDDNEEEDDDDAFPFPTSMTPKRVSTYCTWSGSVIASGTALELWRVLCCVGFANVAASKLNVARNCMRLFRPPRLKCTATRETLINIAQSITIYNMHCSKRLGMDE